MQYGKRDTLIWLNQLGILSDKITKLESYLGDIREIHELDKEYLIDINILSKALQSKLKTSNFEIDVQAEKDKAKDLGIKIITDLDKEIGRASCRERV